MCSFVQVCITLSLPASVPMNLFLAYRFLCLHIDNITLMSRAVQHQVLLTISAIIHERRLPILFCPPSIDAVRKHEYLTGASSKFDDSIRFCSRSFHWQSDLVVLVLGTQWKLISGDGDRRLHFYPCKLVVGFCTSTLDDSVPLGGSFMCI